MATDDPGEWSAVRLESWVVPGFSELYWKGHILGSAVGGAIKRMCFLDLWDWFEILCNVNKIFMAIGILRGSGCFKCPLVEFQVVT